MSIPETVRGPRDLKALSETGLGGLTDEIREFPVQAVSRTVTRLGPDLGVVELAVALHRVFDSPADRIPWDTGHQSHVHELLTGRQDFTEPRGKGGLSGCPSRAQSAHDVIENSHASTALDRAGVPGVDGASHNGMRDMSVLRVLPGLRIAAPRDTDQPRAQPREAVAVDDAPTPVRFPKESAGPPVPALDRVGGMDVLHRADRPDVLLVAVGVPAPVCLRAAELLGARDPRPGLHGGGPAVGRTRRPRPARPRGRSPGGRRDRGQQPGHGRRFGRVAGPRDADVDVPARRLGIPEQFLAHAGRDEVPADIGLTPVDIAGRISATLAVKDADGTVKESQ